MPAVETVVQLAYAFVVGPGLEVAADVKDAVHAGGVPGACELVECLLGAGARGVGVACGCLDGGQVSEDDGALFGGLVGEIFESFGEGFAGLDEVACSELGVALERGEPYG